MLVIIFLCTLTMILTSSPKQNKLTKTQKQMNLKSNKNQLIYKNIFLKNILLPNKNNQIRIIINRLILFFLHPKNNKCLFKNRQIDLKPNKNHRIHKHKISNRYIYLFRIKNNQIERF